jgi:hypothetical protein
MTNVEFNSAFTSVPLTNMTLAYKNEATDFVADKIFPPVSVQKDAGKIYSFGKQALRAYNTEKANGASYNEVKVKVAANDHYFLQSRGLFARLTKDDVMNAETPLDAQGDTAEMLMQNMLIDRERVASAAISTSTISQNTTLTGTDQWNDYANSDPFADIRLARDTIYASTGKEANSMLLQRNVLSTLLDHPKVVERFSGAVVVTEDMVLREIKKVFGIENLYVGRAQAVLANLDDDDADDVLTPLWAKQCVVYYSETSPKLKSLSFGKTYELKAGPVAESMQGDALGQERITHDLQSIVAVKDKYDQVIVDANCAYLIQDAIA